jgi:hypothetical protein
MGCYAIINEAYSKPKKSEKPDKEQKKINLNDKKQVKKFLKEEFLNPLLAYKNEITEKHGHALILWIHGADDKHVKKNVSDIAGVNPQEIKMLIGWGQGPGKNRHTAKNETVDNLIEAFNKTGLTSTFANPNDKEHQFCGWAQDNMNQLFHSKNYKDVDIQSIQLEIRKTGCRDDEGLEPTAKILAEAISSVSDTMTAGEQEDKGQIEILVEEAFQYLKEEFSKSIPKTMHDAGKYLVNKFYGDDYEKAKEKNYKHGSSMAKLIEKIQKDTEGNCPSRTWIYNSINLAIDQKEFDDGDLPKEYGLLGHSHKIKLLNVSDRSDKKDLILETVQEGYTVAKLLERINQVNNKETGKVSVHNRISEDELEKLDLKDIEKIKKQAEKLKENSMRMALLYEANLEKIAIVIKNKMQNNEKLQNVA